MPATKGVTSQTCQTTLQNFGRILTSIANRKLHGGSIGPNHIANARRAYGNLKNCPTEQAQANEELATAIFNNILTKEQAESITGTNITDFQEDVGTAVDKVTGSLDFLKELTKGSTWLRVAMVIGGSILLIIGLFLLLKQLGLRK